MCTQGHIKTTFLTSDHRLLFVDYLLWWPSSKKRMALVIDWSDIALPSTRSDHVTSTRQFQEKGFDFATALSSTAQISLPKSIAPTRVRSWNNKVELRKAWSQIQRAHLYFWQIQFTTFRCLRETWSNRDARGSTHVARGRDARYGDSRRHTVTNILTLNGCCLEVNKWVLWT